jgi:cyanate permease
LAGRQIGRRLAFIQVPYMAVKLMVSPYVVLCIRCVSTNAYKCCRYITKVSITTGYKREENGYFSSFLQVTSLVFSFKISVFECNSNNVILCTKNTSKFFRCFRKSVKNDTGIVRSCLSVCLSVCVSVCLSVCLSACLSVCPSVLKKLPLDRFS